MRFRYSQPRLGVHRILRRIRHGLRTSDAVAATEYAIMLSLIVVVSVGIIRTIGEDFFNLYTMIANAVGETM